MVVVIYDNLDNNQASKDLDEMWCTSPMWLKLARSAPITYASILAIRSWTDTETPTMDGLPRELQEER